MQPANPWNAYGLRCIRCGCALEIPLDLRLMHADCAYCGQDTMLPQPLVEARQRQYAHELEEQNRRRLHDDRAAAARRKTKVWLFAILGGGSLLLMMFGGCVVLGMKLSDDEEEAKRRAQDPSINGHTTMLALFEKMRKEKGCDRILVQPTSHFKDEAPVSLEMVGGDQCVHILGATGTTSPVAIKYSSTIALKSPLPVASQVIDYRLCASETGTHSFKLSSVGNEPFTAAAIECPRTVAEGASRAKANDPVTTGKARVAETMTGLMSKGCSHVVAEPEVSVGPQTYTLTSPAGGMCFNMLVASHFKDVTFDVSLRDPNGTALPVPLPANEMRVIYCSVKAGEYKLEVKPSSGDHFAHVSLDCPRAGPEGLRRETALKKLVRGR